jgi:stress response protein YsnF
MVEEIDVQTRTVETGRVRIVKHVRRASTSVDEAVVRSTYDVERVPVNRIIEQPVEARREGDTWILPVIEEVVVMEKRLMLVEELHVRPRREETHHPRQVDLLKEEIAVERRPAPQPPES